MKTCRKHRNVILSPVPCSRELEDDVTEGLISLLPQKAGILKVGYQFTKD